MSRRRWMQAASGLALAPWFSVVPNRVQAEKTNSRWSQIESIRRTTLKLPYRTVPGRNMARELPHWVYTEICEVTLKSGHVGFGETLLYYTWGATEDSDVERVQGRNAVEHMWDDSLGAGLQMALLDAVARLLEVPLHRLLGQQVHQRTPLSWWNIDTSTADMVSECKEAMRLGYTAYKTKGRPWFDVWDQVEQVSKELPADFKVDMDFNDTLLDAERALPILQELEKFPQIGIYESPIFQSDVPGNQKLKAGTRVPIAMHFGTPEPVVAVREQVCDGFVIGRGARETLDSGVIAAMADMPFWLQLVGSQVTAAYSLHFGAVLSHATWPAVNCHQLYDANTLTRPIEVRDGFAAIPDGPGLGYELNRETMSRFAIPKPPRRPEPPRLIETSWPDGRKMYIANTGEVNFMLNASRFAKTPYFERGVDTRLVPNDGSLRWRELHAKAQSGPVLEK
jgi:L-alanine-DL-glutamate epimerase-like enolase superfamily enzyme